MTRELNHTGAFVVFEIHTRRIIKLHNHHKTALNQIRKLGKDTHAMRPVADRAYYELVEFLPNTTL